VSGQVKLTFTEAPHVTRIELAYQLESWGSEGPSMAQKLMAHVMARAQCALLKVRGGTAKAAPTRGVA
jgi:hypothetical protein